MTQIKMKENLFRDKISNIIIRRKGIEYANNPVIFVEKFPYELELIIQIDFLNIKPNKNYLLMINQINEEQTNNKNLHVSNIRTYPEDMLLNNDKILGKTVGFFDIKLNIDNPKDVLIHTILIDGDGNSDVLDQSYNYISFIGER
ncbi:hypothetical protein [Streptococcus uberis]|uniref:hypothetical protein n=1 Tax=Streptococcus uberis TaxID=1349 RepID=UPI00193971EA|nr:hypothetical protein [Streptococcus uberis]